MQQKKNVKESSQMHLFNLWAKNFSQSTTFWHSSRSFYRSENAHKHFSIFLRIHFSLSKLSLKENLSWKKTKLDFYILRTYFNFFYVWFHLHPQKFEKKIEFFLIFIIESCFLIIFVDYNFIGCCHRERWIKLNVN